MKNQKLNGNTVKSGALADSTYKNSVNWFSKIKLNVLDTDKVWSRISDQLENMDKKALSWFMLTATTCTMLVAAGLQYFDSSQWDKKEVKDTVETATTSLADKHEEPQKFTINHVDFKSVEHEPKREHLNAQLELAPPNLPVVNNTEHHSSLLGQLKTAKKPVLSFSGRLGYVNSSLVPEISMDFELIKLKSAKGNKSFKLGYSLQVANQRPQQEAASSQLQVLHFINMTYATEPLLKNGWNAQLGYLLNADSQVYKDATIKASVHKKISKHVGLGPELILTNNLKSIYPGISLWVGS